MSTMNWEVKVNITDVMINQNNITYFHTSHITFLRHTLITTLLSTFIIWTRKHQQKLKSYMNSMCKSSGYKILIACFPYIFRNMACAHTSKTNINCNRIKKMDTHLKDILPWFKMTDRKKKSWILQPDLDWNLTFIGRKPSTKLISAHDVLSTQLLYTALAHVSCPPVGTKSDELGKQLLKVPKHQ